MNYLALAVGGNSSENNFGVKSRYPCFSCFLKSSFINSLSNANYFGKSMLCPSFDPEKSNLFMWIIRMRGTKISVNMLLTGLKSKSYIRIAHSRANLALQLVVRIKRVWFKKVFDTWEKVDPLILAFLLANRLQIFRDHVLTKLSMSYLQG